MARGGIENRLTNVVQGTGANTFNNRYEYDAAGNRTKVVYANGVETRYDFNDAN